jgi:hypothetical protein
LAILQVLWQIQDRHPWSEEQRRFQTERCMVMQKILPFSEGPGEINSVCVSLSLLIRRIFR